MSIAGSPFGNLLKRKWWATPLVHALLVAGSTVFLFPMLWMISTSLKPIDQTMAFPPKWLPEPFQWRNYVDAVNYIPFLQYTINTLMVSGFGIIGAVASNALVAYSFARLSWPGRDWLFGLTLATMMIPFPVVMVPLYSVFRELGWIGTLAPLIVPAYFGSAFNIFLLRQFFLRVPKDMAEAATLDGASEFRIFWSIYVPLAKPALAVVALFHFIWAWNDFLGPLLYLTDQSTYTLSLGLQFYQSQHGGTQWHLLMAASTLTVLPVIAIFFLTQRTFLRGITFLKNVDVN
jgi:multiple sugar transport system permease protein